MRAWLELAHDRRAAAEPLLLRTTNGLALVRRLPNRRSDRREVLLLEGGTGELTADALASIGLTPRQAETLRLAALGHTASQAAAQMHVSTRTVEKHLQHVYRKLGVGNLAEAAATAWAAVGLTGPSKHLTG